MQLKRYLAISEITVILLFAVMPLFFTFPFRINIFLSWEGAYRMSNGQIPFRDFGTPLGGMYWVIPAIFFKIFGSQMITLIKAQVFINIISGLAFRSILKTLHVNEGVRFGSVLLYSLAFTFPNYWPWYNHSVIVYAFIALLFALKVVMQENDKYKLLLSLGAAVFTFFAFFTKQDGGGLIFMFCSILLLYYGWLEKKWKYLLIYLAGTIFTVTGAVLIFSMYDFGYWFNHGQPPHNARLSGTDFLNAFLSDSQWLKFYFFVIILITIPGIIGLKRFVRQKADFVFFLVTSGILCFAAIYQITSYTPSNGNIFFHGFAFAYIFSAICRHLPNIGAARLSLVLGLGVMLWWSDGYFNYIQRIFKINVPDKTTRYSADGENIVDMHNARQLKKNDGGKLQGAWVNSNLKTLKKIKIPEATNQGIERLLNMDIVKNKKDIRVLNMSELTFLAKEIPYKLETGHKYPLWYHFGVGMFKREVQMFDNRIKENYYDLILFEDIPELNNFYPIQTQSSLMTYYRKVDSFPAPRSVEFGTIEVYIRQ